MMPILDWFRTLDPVGFAALCLLVGVPLSLLLSFVLAHRYRRSVLRAMQGTGGSARPGRTAEIPSPGYAAPERLLRLVHLEEDGGPAAPEIPAVSRRKRFRMARGIVLAGLCQTLLSTLLLLWNYGFASFSLRQFLAVWLALAWPIVPSALYVSVGDRKLLLLAAALFLGLGCSLFGIRQFAFLALWLSGIPIALALLVSLRSIRAVGPISLLAAVPLAMAVVLAFPLSLGVQLATRFPMWLSMGVVNGLALAGSLLAGRVILGLLARRYLSRKTSDQLLVINVWWGLYSFWICMILGLTWKLAGLVGLLPLAAYFAVLHWQLPAASGHAAEGPLARLLLLRVFGFRHRAERLLGSVGRLWRYAGPIDLIAGPDLATATLEPHELLEFLGGKLNRQFVRSGEDLDERLRSREECPDRDGRYRVRELFCHDDTWQTVLRRLAREAAVVLMDLRSFSSANEGCRYELQQLLRWVPLGRILLLVDRTTDEGLLQSVLEREWAHLSIDSVNAGCSDPKLRMLRLERENTAAAKKMFAVLGGMAQRAA
jgi:hypothetical protein